MTALSEKLRRLTEMSLAEVRFRGAQKVRIAREQWQLASNGTRSADSAWWRFWDIGKIAEPELQAALQAGDATKASALLPRYFAAQRTPRFYWDHGLRTELVAAHQQYFPDRAEQVRAEANAICEHRFRIFAYPEIVCGREIPWRRDLIHGMESGLDHYARIPYSEFPKVGDSKVVWELNRHQHLLTLCQASLLTGDERYAEECLAQWQDWQRGNPYLRGINWASSLEVAFRSWSWLWILHLLLGSRSFTGHHIAELTAALARHAKFVAVNLSSYFSPNTHLLGEGFALFVIGLMLPELCGAESWREAGRTILLEQMQRQVRNDGSHIEQASYYHHYATNFFLCAAILAERNGCAFPASYRDRLERMVEFILYTAWPSGRQPMTGDADGGRLLALAARDPNDQRATLSTAAVYFRRSDFRRQAGRFHEETLWLMGSQAAQQFLGLEPPTGQETSKAFVDAGLVVMRSDWEKRARMLLFDAGPQGMGTCAHGHADALNFVCSADGIDWLVDPGMFVYTASLEWRDFFRSTRAHNTVGVDSRDQAERVDTFKWRKIPQVRLERWASLASLDFAVGWQNGYLRLPEPIEHRRYILFVKPDYWIVSDELNGHGRHTFDFFFHFPPEVKLEPLHADWVASKCGSRFLIAPTAGTEFRVATGEKSPIQGWYSEDYGHCEPAPVLIATARTAPPAWFHWLLCPVLGAPPRLRELPGDGVRLVVETDSWTDFFAAKGKQIEESHSQIATDAELAFVRREKSGTFGRLVLLKGRWAESCGQLLMHSDRFVEEFEAIRKGNMLEIRVRSACRVRLLAPGVAQARVNGKPAKLLRDGDWIELDEEN